MEGEEVVVFSGQSPGFFGSSRCLVNHARASRHPNQNPSIKSIVNEQIVHMAPWQNMDTKLLPFDFRVAVNILQSECEIRDLRHHCGFELARATNPFAKTAEVAWIQQAILLAFS